MLTRFFETRKRAERDTNELQSMRIDHGSDLKTVLRQRASDNNLGERDRRHWKRLLNKVDGLTI